MSRLDCDIEKTGPTALSNIPDEAPPNAVFTPCSIQTIGHDPAPWRPTRHGTAQDRAGRSAGYSTATNLIAGRPLISFMRSPTAGRAAQQEAPYQRETRR